MSTKGRSLELYFIDGRPDGMLTAEVFNWTGHVLRTPRTQIAEALRREEGARTGVYLLLGPGEDRERVYIGEAEDLRSRFKDHIAKLEWWETTVLISTSGDVLHKAHVKYLEARLHEIACEVGKARLDNANTPTRASPSAAAAIVTGRSTNGRTAWIHKATGKTYAEWEQAQFEEASK